MERVDLDDLDRGLVHALQLDGRAPFRRLGEVLGASDQTIARRYARLRAARGLRVLGLTDPRWLSGPSWALRLRAAPEAAAQIANALARRPDTSWVSLCSGATEIFAAVEGAGVNALLLEVLPRTRHVRDVRAELVLNVFDGGAGRPYTKCGPLDGAQVAHLRAHLPEPGGSPTSLSSVDRQLLASLSRDGRAPVEELCGAAGVSAGTARRRVHELRVGGVLHVDVDVDLALFDRPVRSLVWLTVAAGALDAVGGALASHVEVAYAAATTGRANVVASVSTRDTAALYRYASGELGGLAGVAEVEIAPVVRHVKAVVTQDQVLRRPVPPPR